MDTDCIKYLTPGEAQAALEALNANNAPVTAREAVEIVKLRRALEAQAEQPL